ncbi:tropomyosin, partial [Frankia sp. AgKG'84/4]|nr:tropomyosin [Frankia sp. AgKG'84/4]
MLYLAGQILAYVLVAMVIGAALAWVFLIAPLRRQIRQAQDGQPAERPAGGPPVPYEQRVAREMAVPEQAWPGESPALAAIPAPPIAPMLELQRPAVSAQAPAPADDLAGQDAPVADEPLGADGGTDAGREATAEAPEFGDGRLTGAELATTGPISLPVGLGRPGEPVAELVELLRHQRDDSALDKADLSARLAVAEQRAAEAEQRISVAERHASTASARVEEIESALRSRVEGARVEGARVEATDGPAGSTNSASPAEDPMTGPIVLELAREKELLSEQLAEAEGRAAKFSSRLAMARTEAEDAQRQVATMTTRLDRHQAEWAAERLSLLARLAVVEGALDSGAVDPRDAAAAAE